MLHSQMRQRGLQVPSAHSSNGFSLNTGQVQGTQSQADVEQVKRQLEDLQRELEREKNTTGAVIEQQEKEIEDCKKELENQTANEVKLKTRARELQEELDATLKRIEQLQRGGTFTPVRRKPVVASGSGSKNPSPYNRNTSGNKGSGSATRQPAVGTALYNRNGSSNTRPPALTN